MPLTRSARTRSAIAVRNTSRAKAICLAKADELMSAMGGKQTLPSAVVPFDRRYHDNIHEDPCEYESVEVVKSSVPEPNPKSSEE